MANKLIYGFHRYSKPDRRDLRLLASQDQECVSRRLRLLAALLDEHRRSVAEPSDEDFHELHSQIRALADLDKMMQTANSAGRICIAAYLRSYCDKLRQAFLNGMDIAFAADFQPGALRIDTCRWLTLILGELFCIALRYCVQRTRSGAIVIRLTEDGQVWSLGISVSDAGCAASSQGRGKRSSIEQIINPVQDLSLVRRIVQGLGGAVCGNASAYGMTVLVQIKDYGTENLNCGSEIETLYPD